MEASDVIFLHEVHGSYEDAILFQSRFRGKKICASEGPSRTAGGLITCVDQQLLNNCPFQFEHVVVKGRIAALELAGPAGTIVLINVHLNPAWTVTQFRHLFSLLKQRSPPPP